MSRALQLAAVTLTVILTFTLTFAVPFTLAPGVSEPVDINTASRELVDAIRYTAINAKGGKDLDTLRADVLKLQATASGVLNDQWDAVAECDVQLTVKMAAARTGSHEVLTILLADDPLSVLSGRLSLSLAFLEEVAHMMEDELSLNDDVGPHLTAIIFGTNITLDIIDTADKTIKALVASHHDISEIDVTGKERVRRSYYDLGYGWTLGFRGVQWDSYSGRYTFNARPTFDGFPPGVMASFTIRF